jgi:selenocysteine lyase/cysteine desulfurase
MITAQTRLRDFPALASMTYLNTAAEGIPPRCVGEALQEYWQDKLKGMKGRDDHFVRFDECREIAARMIHLTPAEVSFCSCSSEACNLLASALDLKANDEVVVNELEYPSSVTPWLTSAAPTRLRIWEARDRELSIDDLRWLLNRRTRLVAVSLVSFYNGHRVEWKSLAETVHGQAPNAILSVDVTQALGRCLFDCTDADFIFSSTHKWTLGIHGGCIVGIPVKAAELLTTRAGGWYHIVNAFGADRFQRAVLKKGAASFSVGMPSFAPIYALNASLRYLDSIGIEKIVQQADPLVEQLQQGLTGLGLKPLAPLSGSGIVAFQHAESAKIHAALQRENIHVMNPGGRIRVSLHGYNTVEDVNHLLQALDRCLDQSGLTVRN